MAEACTRRGRGLAPGRPLKCPGIAVIPRDCGGGRAACPSRCDRDSWFAGHLLRGSFRPPRTVLGGLREGGCVQHRLPDTVVGCPRWAARHGGFTLGGRSRERDRYRARTRMRTRTRGTLHGFRSESKKNTGTHYEHTHSKTSTLMFSTVTFLYNTYITYNKTVHQQSRCALTGLTHVSHGHSRTYRRHT